MKEVFKAQNLIFFGILLATLFASTFLFNYLNNTMYKVVVVFISLIISSNSLAKLYIGLILRK